MPLLSEEQTSTPNSYFPSLPTEILRQIFLRNLCPAEDGNYEMHRFDGREAFRLIRVCRRFHIVVSDIWYSHCDVSLCTGLLDVSLVYPGYFVKAGLSRKRVYPDTQGYLVAFNRFTRQREPYGLSGSVDLPSKGSEFLDTKDRFELYKARGHDVRMLSFSHSRVIWDTINTPPGPRGPEIKLLPNDHFFIIDPDLPGFTTPFTAAFPNLTTITIKDNSKQQSGFKPEQILACVTNILSSCLCLRHLELSLALTFTIALSLEEEIESLPSVSTSPVQLETLSLYLHILSGRNDVPFPGIWLLTALTHLLPASVKGLRSLNFNSPRFTPIGYQFGLDRLQENDSLKQADIEKHFNPSGRVIPLPALQYLKISADRGCINVFDAFMNASRDTLERLDIDYILYSHQTHRQIRYINHLLQKFSNIQTLRLNCRSPQHLNKGWQLINNIAHSIKDIKNVTLFTIFRGGDTEDGFRNELRMDLGRTIEFYDMSIDESPFLIYGKFMRIELRLR
ncbi:hypothetical protein TWF730_001542 [Orbilia blumenaviensis]|uniref:F-box domain-containing protein n=1 Tax=Orbilia blumenaviensis TaxID=1796055 RepID=A0AAV9UMF2_9PEZI